MKNLSQFTISEWFGFLDHDMIPVSPIQLSQRIASQEVYGTLNDGNSCWNLWVGYCFFKYAKVASLPMNFLYDFSRGLDTWGRNWDYLYSQYARPQIKFADDIRIELKINDQFQSTVQLIDNAWVHIGGVSYNNNLAPKEVFFEHLIENFQQGSAINDMVVH